MEVQSVSVQFDYATFPVRSDAAGRVTDQNGQVDLPMHELREAFRRWSADMSRLLAARSMDRGDLADLNDRGLALAQRLRRELGEGYRIEYFDEVLGSFRQLE